MVSSGESRGMVGKDGKFRQSSLGEVRRIAANFLDLKGSQALQQPQYLYRYI
jgi:hypothetical protein